MEDRRVIRWKNPLNMEVRRVIRWQGKGLKTNLVKENDVEVLIEILDNFSYPTDFIEILDNFSYPTEFLFTDEEIVQIVKKLQNVILNNFSSWEKTVEVRTSVPGYVGPEKRNKKGFKLKVPLLSKKK